MVDQIERRKKENVGGGARGGGWTLFIYRRGEGRNQQEDKTVRPDWQRDTRTRIGAGMGMERGRAQETASGSPSTLLAAAACVGQRSSGRGLCCVAAAPRARHATGASAACNGAGQRA